MPKQKYIIMAYRVGQGVEEEKLPIRYKTIFNSSTNDISYLTDSDNNVEHVWGKELFLANNFSFTEKAISWYL